jgi:hypothetical protein
MCFPAKAKAPLIAPKAPKAPEAVAKATVSGVSIKKKKDKAAGFKGPSLVVPRTSVNIPGA